MWRRLPVALSLITAGFLLPAGLQAQQHTGNSVQTTTPASSRAPVSFAQHPVTHNPSFQGSKTVGIDSPPAARHRGTEHRPSGRPQHPDLGRGGHDGGGNAGRYPYIYGTYPAVIPYIYGAPLGYSEIGSGPDDGEQQAAPQQEQAAQLQAAPQQEDAPPPIDEAAPPPPAEPKIAAGTAPSFRPEYQGAEYKGAEYHGAGRQGPGLDWPASPASVQAQPTTTLIFKDGRPAVQVHNYALTGSTLYGDTGQEIPLATLNLPATIEANRAAGVDFALPVSR